MNSDELKACMKRHRDNYEKLAEALGLHVSGICSRVNGKIEFRRSEINTIRQRYGLSAEETMRIFFNDKVS